MKRPPSPKWPLCIFVLRITDLEQDVHVISLTFATHFAASQIPTLSNQGNEELTRKLTRRGKISKKKSELTVNIEQVYTDDPSSLKKNGYTREKNLVSLNEAVTRTGG